ncbi:MAG: hypothetical protein DRR19_05245 [Candidatus Parabeggiatoa sp. nov. 1]|nr:MAG: hypothetical protein DRR19_05245 [Gammaproteobacteria bacterium]
MKSDFSPKSDFWSKSDLFLRKWICSSVEKSDFPKNGQNRISFLEIRFFPKIGFLVKIGLIFEKMDLFFS